MNRYLLNISYIGSPFKAFTKLSNKNINNLGVNNTTVIGAIESALLLLKPLNALKVATSSRTDVGVHALHNTIHVDLERKNGRPYDTEHVTGIINRYMDNFELPIRILSTELVPHTFHVRSKVMYRSYLYRLAFLKTSIDQKETSNSNCDDDVDELLENGEMNLFTQFIPWEENNRCYFRITSKGFDVDRMKDTAQLFVGRHDFRTFMANSGETRQKVAQFAVRTIHSLEIIPGRPQTTSFNFEQANEHYQYIDIHITATSFVYRQIRRIVGALMAVGEGIISKRDVYEMITIPSSNSWNDVYVRLIRLRTVPAGGLYLTKVEYHESAKKCEQILS